MRLTYTLLLVFLLGFNQTFAVTTVSGVISTNTIWTLANSPYQVTGDVTVNPGFTLTIEPGVVVQINAGKIINIQGQLRAVGTAAQQITFTNTTGQGNWAHIRFYNGCTSFDSTTTNGCLLKYCIVNGGGSLAINSFRGELYMDGGTVGILNCTFNGFLNVSPLQNVIVASPQFSMTGRRYVYIKDCLFNFNRGSSTDPTDYFIYIIGTNYTGYIYNNTFSGIVGQMFLPPTVSTQFMFVKGNTFQNCRVSIDANATPPTAYEKIIVTNNKFFNSRTLMGRGTQLVENVFVNCYMDYSQPYLVKRNIFTGTKASEIAILGYSGTPLIMRNVFDFRLSANKDFRLTNYDNIVGNHFLGLIPSTTQTVFNQQLVRSNVYFSNNTLYECSMNYPVYGNNQMSLYAPVNTFLFSQNNFMRTRNTGNAGLAPTIILTTLSSSTGSLNAANNWWGTTNASRIDSMIWDNADDNTRQIIQENPIRTSPSVLAPMSPPVVTKQLNGSGQVELNWAANAEADLVGYKVYYGGFDGYSFTNTVNVGNVLTYTLPLGASLSDTIGVTAFDTAIGSAVWPQSVLNGNESWYGYASLPLPVASFTGPSASVCTGTSYTLTSTSTNAQGFAWSSTNASNVVFGNASGATSSLKFLQAGSYTVTLTVNNQAGQTSTSSTTYTVSGPTVTAYAGNNGIICGTGSVPLGIASVSGYSYSWSPSTGLSATNIAQPSASPTTTTSYIVTVSANGCSFNDTVVVSYFPAVSTPTASSNSPVCTTQTIQLLASTIANATYRWNGPNGFISTLQNPTISNMTVSKVGTYSVVAIANGCTSAVAQTQVFINFVPPATTAGGPATICIGQTLNLTATQSSTNATYVWSGPNGFTSTQQNPSIPNVTVAVAGTYSVYAIEGSCTTATSSTTVAVYTNPVSPVASSNSPVCSQLTLNLTAGTVSNASYYWTGPNGFTSNIQNPIINTPSVAYTGAFTVVAYNFSTGCTSAVSQTNVVIKQVPVPPTVSSNSPLCLNGTLQLQAATIAGATYSWTGPNGFTSTQQNPTIPNVGTANAGNYIAVAIENGCTSGVAQTNVVIGATIQQPTASAASTLCEGSTLLLNASLITGVSYFWTGPNGFISNQRQPSLLVSPINSGTYSVVAIANACTSAASSVNVTVYPATPTPTATSNSPLCSGGDSLRLFANTIPNVTYQWNGPNGFGSTSQNPVADPFAFGSGDYICYAIRNGCFSDPDTVNVVFGSTPFAPQTDSTTITCLGSPITLNAIPPGISYTYFWTGPNGFTSTALNPTLPFVTQSDSGIYSIVAIANGCSSAVATTRLIVLDTIGTPNASSNSPVCQGGILRLFADTVGSANYFWSGPNGYSSNVQNASRGSLTLADAGVYTVYAVENGCTSAVSQTTVVVTARPATPTASSNSPRCSGQNLNLTTPTVPGATYFWTGPAGYALSIQNPILFAVTSANAGTYTVRVIANGCTSLVAQTAVVVNNVPARPTLSSNSPVKIGQTLQLNSTTNASNPTYAWTGPNGFTSTSANPTLLITGANQGGLYKLKVANNGCNSAEAQTNVVIDTTTTAIDPATALEVSLYPNPSTGQSTLKLGQSAAISLTLNNALGQLVREYHFAPAEAHELSFVGLPAGVYVLNGRIGSSTYQQRVVLNP